MEKLTLHEEEAMLRIWEKQPCFVRELLEEYPDPKPPYTTLASVIKNLERKGYVKSRRYGNTYEYTALIPQQEYTRTYMGTVVRNYFRNSYKQMVSFFAEEEKISARELEEILHLIEKGDRP